MPTPEAIAKARRNCIRCGKASEFFELCVACINKKHVALRGSMELLFTRGTSEASCQQLCNCGLYHPCHLRANHNVVISHRFSWECSNMRNG